jgi:hypothetical protein
MTIPAPTIIPAAAATDAMFRAARAAREKETVSDIMRDIAETFPDTVADDSIVALVAPRWPEWDFTYHAPGRYDSRRYLSLRLNRASDGATYYIYLCTKSQRTVNAADLRRAAGRSDATAAKLLEAVTAFPDAATRYDQLAAELTALRETLNSVLQYSPQP